MKKILPLLLLLALASIARADDNDWNTFYAPVYEDYKTYVLVMNYSDEVVEPEFEVMLDGRLYPHYQSLWTPPRTARAKRFE